MYLKRMLSHDVIYEEQMCLRQKDYGSEGDLGFLFFHMKK